MRKFEEGIVAALALAVLVGVMVRGFHDAVVLAETPFEIGHIATVSTVLDVSEVYRVVFDESGRPILVSQTSGCRVDEGQRMEVVATPASDKVTVQVVLLGNPSEGQCDDGVIAIVPRNVLKRPALRM